MRQKCLTILKTFLALSLALLMVFGSVSTVIAAVIPSASLGAGIDLAATGYSVGDVENLVLTKDGGSPVDYSVSSGSVTVNIGSTGKYYFHVEMKNTDNLTNNGEISKTVSNWSLYKKDANTNDGFLTVSTIGSYKFTFIESSGSIKMSVVFPSSEEEDVSDDEWYFYGDKFGGWSWTDVSSISAGKMIKDADTGYFYVVHDVPESGNDRFRVWDRTNNTHYKPSSSTQLTATNTSQATGVTATVGWSNNYFGLEDSFADQSNKRLWWDPASKKVWITDNSYTVKAGTCSNGSVTVDDKSEVTGLSIEGNDTVELLATPVEHYHFVKWDDNAKLVYTAQNNASTTATVKGDATVTATFAINTHSITLPTAAQYTVTTNQEDNTAVPYGTSVTLTASPVGIYKITGITVTNGSETVATKSFTGTGQETLTFNMPDANVNVAVTYGVNRTAKRSPTV